MTFQLVLIAGFAVVPWMALNIPTARLVVLSLAIFIIEYLKEGIGIGSEMWVYHGKANCYNFRISFAKNKTHCFCHYTLTWKNIYSILPMQDKFKEYHSKREYDWSTIETRRKMRRFGEHFDGKPHYRENPWYDKLFPGNPFLAVT